MNHSTTTNKDELAEGIVAALAAVVDYLWNDERNNYFEVPPDKRPGHIFQSLLMLNRWMSNPNGEPSPFGACPLCTDGQNDGYFNVGRVQWMVCHIHGFKWCIGENFFRSWRDETPERWQENTEQYASYLETRP